MLDIWRYYGFDWAAMLFMFASLYRLGNHKRDGFVYGILANLCYIAFGFIAMSLANQIANAAFLALNVRGFIRWRKDVASAAGHASEIA